MRDVSAPLFDRLGTPDEHERHIAWDVGHFSFPIGEFIRANLDWLGRYFGPISKTN